MKQDDIKKIEVVESSIKVKTETIRNLYESHKDKLPEFSFIRNIYEEIGELDDTIFINDFIWCGENSLKYFQIFTNILKEISEQYGTHCKLILILNENKEKKIAFWSGLYRNDHNGYCFPEQNLVMNFNVFESNTGSLIPMEFNDLPFIPKRVFTVAGNKRENPPYKWRGNHSSIKNKQVIVCIKGEMLFCISDEWRVQNSYFLKEGEWIHCPNLKWVKYRFLKNNTIMLSLCSHSYNEDDYLNNISDFIDYHKKIRNE